MPTNRWGHTFSRGDLVNVTTATGRYVARYARLDKPSDFSRAYGRQALISLGDGPIEPASDMTVGIDDLSPCATPSPYDRGAHVRVHPATDLFMMGETHATVLSAIGDVVRVKGDRSGRTFRLRACDVTLAGTAFPL